MADFSFNKLNLKNVDVTTAGNGTLPPGRHICKVSDATLKDTRAGGKMIELQFNEIDGKGGIRNWLNVMVPSSEKATQIGREQLKGLLVWGGHEDPDNIGKHGVGSIKGLVVGVRVVADTYVKDGLEIVPVSHVDEVLAHALCSVPEPIEWTEADDLASQPDHTLRAPSPTAH